MSQRRNPATSDRATSTTRLAVPDPTASQAVSWYPVHEFLQAVLAQANCGPLPWPGTPSWCELSDGDPRKLLALAEFGQHHALRLELNQEARAEASHAVAASADWPSIAREVRRHADAVRTGAYIPRRGV